MITDNDLKFDKDHIWHPYTSMTSPLQVYAVEKAEGVKIFLNDKRTLIGRNEFLCLQRRFLYT